MKQCILDRIAELEKESKELENAYIKDGGNIVAVGASLIIIKELQDLLKHLEQQDTIDEEARDIIRKAAAFQKQKEQEQIVDAEEAACQFMGFGKEHYDSADHEKHNAFIAGWKARGLQGIKILSEEEIDQIVNENQPMGYTHDDKDYNDAYNRRKFYKQGIIDTLNKLTK